MFQSALSASFGSSGFGRPQQFANAYRQVGVESGVLSGSPHQLVLMLYDGFLEAVSRARGGMVAGDIELKGRQIVWAVRIIEEGLKCALNMEQGGELAKNLHSLYSCVVFRLTQANLRNDPKLLDEVEQLIRPVRDAWATIGAAVSHGTGA